MAFKTKEERYAYAKGLHDGNRGKRPYPRGRAFESRRPEKKSPANWNFSTHSFDHDDFFAAALAPSVK